jgi:succinyl-CoA synthetase beta subunit
VDIYEYQTKAIFASFGIPVPEGEVASSPIEARQIAARLDGPVAVKAQVLAGGRSRAGGIALAQGPQKAQAAAERILGTAVRGLPVRRVLVERAADIAQELYLGFVLDRSVRRIVVMASSRGGVDIEEVARESPESVVRFPLDPFLGLMDFRTRALAFRLELKGNLVREFAAIVRSLHNAFRGYGAMLAEINPLALTGEGRLLALDAKLVLDDSALFRHPELAQMREAAEEPVEREAREQGLSYIRLEGDIGCLVNGAGLAMATMDLIKLYGGEPANFLDIGGGAPLERIRAALDILLRDRRVRAVLVNIFGGLTRCDEVARGLLEAMEVARPSAPIVVRLAGTRAEEGRALLAGSDIHAVEGLTQAARLAVKLAKEA